MSLVNVRYGFIVEAKALTRPLVDQVHGAEVVEVTGPETRETLLKMPPKADGVYTTERSLELYVFSADCLPLLFFSSSEQGAIAAVHCGWRGALRGIPSAALQKLKNGPGDLHVVFGPSILGCCFEVKEDFVREFLTAGKKVEPYLERSRGRMFFDLPRYVREEELRDIPEERIHMDENRCTYCTAPPLPSFRRNGGTDPRIRAWIKKG